MWSRRMGRTLTPLPHTRGHPRALSWFRPGCSASRCAPRPGDVVPTRLGGCTQYPSRRVGLVTSSRGECLLSSCRRDILHLLPLPRYVARKGRKRCPGGHCAFVSCRCVRSTQNDLFKGPRCLGTLDTLARLCLVGESVAPASRATTAGTRCPECLFAMSCLARRTATPLRWGPFGKSPLCGPARIHWRRGVDGGTQTLAPPTIVGWCGRLLRMQVL